MNQPASWEALIHTLRSEREAYHDLSVLLIEELPFLKSMDHQRLLEVNSRKETVLDSIRRLEQERLACLKEFAGCRSLDDFAKWLASADFSHVREVQAALNELVNMAKRVKQQSEENAALTFRALYIVREALSLIYSGLGTQPVYGDSGQLTFPSVALTA